MIKGTILTIIQLFMSLSVRNTDFLIIKMSLYILSASTTLYVFVSE